MTEVPVIERFRKRPLEVEAIHAQQALSFAWNHWSSLPQWLKDAYDVGNVLFLNDPPRVEIETLEGTMTAQSSDWIIRGIKGELYPCKPDVFAATYEAAPEPLELSEVERVAVEHTEHMSTCHESACVDCMKELRAVRRTIKAVEPVIKEQVGREVDAFYVRALCEFIYEHADTDEGAEDGLQFSVRELAELVNGWQLDAWELYLREREPARFAGAALAPVAAGEPEAVTQE